MTSFGTFVIKFAASVSGQSALTPDLDLLAHTLYFSCNVYFLHIKGGIKITESTDLMLWVVPMPGLCIALSLNSRYASGVLLITGAFSNFFTISSSPLNLQHHGLCPTLRPWI